MEQAMYYELIVRRANGYGGRYCVAGADADIYRALQRDWAKSMDGKLHSTEFERGYSLGIITAYLKDSIERLIKSGEYSEDKVRQLEKSYNDLHTPTIEAVDNTITRVADLLNPL